MSIDFTSLGKDLSRQVKSQLDALGAELQADVEPILWKLADDVVLFGKKFAEGQDVATDIVHLQARTKLAGAIIFTKAQNKFTETLWLIVETSARVLGVAIKAAI